MENITIKISACCSHLISFYSDEPELRVAQSNPEESGLAIYCKHLLKYNQTMKHTRIPSLIMTLLILSLLPLSLSGQLRTAAFAMNERLGRGINMGNSFEAPTETEWGNPWNPEYFRIMSELGFKHVRIPIRWEPAARSLAISPYTITPSFLERIKQVVDVALANKLHPIINMHHHDALFDDPDGQKERFISQWGQISTYFQNYSDSLLFEVLNEPHGNITPAKWNQFFADALSEIRTTNPTRCVLMGTADFGGLSGVQYINLPDDEYILLSVHYYNPFQFTHQGAEWVGESSNAWLGTQWHDTEAERQTIINEFSATKQFSHDHHIPVHVGEFGAYNKADLASRVRWTNFLARWFEEEGYSWAYWEFSAGFGIYNPISSQVLTALADALLVNPMPQPTPVELTPVYISNFSTGTDGWILNASNGAVGSLSAVSGALNLTLTQGGTLGWHAQMVKGPVSLIKDKLYRLSFKASSQAARGASIYLGNASNPWNAYSGYFWADITSVESEFSYTFTMNNASDALARIVFDVGNSTIGLSLKDVRVEMITIGPSSVQTQKETVRFFPNPVKNILTIENVHLFKHIFIYDINGKPVHNQKSGIVEMGKLAKGLYIVELVGINDVLRIKVLKD